MLDTNEKTLVEAIKSMLNSDDEIGLAFHKDDEENRSERGYEYLHNNIDQLVELKTAELTHATSIMAGFRKVHDYKYIDDPTFKTALKKEMTAMAVPADERAKIETIIDKVIDEVKNEQKEWSEKDSGFNPHLDEIIDMSKPEQPIECEIIDSDLNDENVEFELGDASPGHMN